MTAPQRQAVSESARLSRADTHPNAAGRGRAGRSRCRARLRTRPAAGRPRPAPAPSGRQPCHRSGHDAQRQPRRRRHRRRRRAERLGHCQVSQVTAAVACHQTGDAPRSRSGPDHGPSLSPDRRHATRWWWRRVIVRARTADRRQRAHVRPRRQLHDVAVARAPIVRSSPVARSSSRSRARGSCCTQTNASSRSASLRSSSSVGSSVATRATSRDRQAAGHQRSRRASPSGPRPPRHRPVPGTADGSRCDLTRKTPTPNPAPSADQNLPPYPRSASTAVSCRQQRPPRARTCDALTRGNQAIKDGTLGASPGIGTLGARGPVIRILAVSR